MHQINQSLRGVRVLAAINGLELFGHERGNIEVFKALREQGAEVMVGVNALHDGGDVGAYLRGLGFPVFMLPFSNQWSWQWLKKDPLSVFEKIRAVFVCSLLFHRVIRQFRPTHIHLGIFLTYSYLALALMINRMPLIYRMGDYAPADSPFNLRIWRMAMRRSSKVVANSKFVLSTALSAGAAAKKLLIVHNTAPTKAVDLKNGTADCNERDPDRIVYVGQIAEHKGLIVLIESFAVIAQENPTLKLDILGDTIWGGNFSDRLLRLIASHGLGDRVTLHGQVSDPTSFYKRASLHVAPSIWDEPFANVVLEAKREGTPTIVFPSGGLPEMVRHKVDGYICDGKTAIALVEGFRWMLSDLTRLKAMGLAAREDFDARFSREYFSEAWADVYRRGGSVV